MSSIFLQVVVAAFDLTAFGLSIAAEHRRNTAIVKTVSKINYCHYDSDIATGYGVSSLLLLLASQILIMVGTKCLCAGKGLRPSGSRVWAVIFFIICWVCFSIAEICLLVASVKNTYHTKYYAADSPESCSTLRKGVFKAGAVFVFATFVFSELYYVSYSKATDLPYYPQETGVRMEAL